jgi:protein TonB
MLALVALILGPVALRREAAPQQGVEIFWERGVAEQVDRLAEPGAAPAPPGIEAEEALAPPAAPPATAAPPPVETAPPPPLAEPAAQPPPLPLAEAPRAPQGEVAAAPPPPEPAREASPEQTAEPAPQTEAVVRLPPSTLLRPAEPPPPPEPPARPAARPAARPQPAAPGPAETGAGGVGRAEGAIAPPSQDARFANAGPPYPEMARALGQQGTVGLLIQVSAEGRVTEVRVAQSSGFPTLDQAARRAAEQWRFRPAQQDGRPVAGSIRTSVQFRLQ